MYKKTRVLITLIVVLLLSNIVLAYNLYDKNNEEHQRNLGLYARADRSLDEAVNYIGKLYDEWDNINDKKKMVYLGDAERELALALYSMSDSGNFFQPLKLYREGIYTMKRKILKQVDSTLQKKYIRDLHNDFNVLWVFLAENNISEMTYEDTMSEWKNVRSELKTKEITNN